MLRNKWTLICTELLSTRATVLYCIRIALLSTLIVVVLSSDIFALDIVMSEPVAGCDIVQECKTTIDQHMIEGRLSETVDILSDALRGVRSEKHCIALLLPYYDRLVADSRGDSLLVSKAYRLLGYTYKNYLNDLETALKCYLLAEGYMGGRCCRSDFWYLQYPIGSLYARLGDYEKANGYFQRILNWLMATDGSVYRQSLLYKEMANVDVWRGYRYAAIEKYNLAQQLAYKASSSDAVVAVILSKTNLYLNLKDSESAAASLVAVANYLAEDTSSIKDKRWTDYYEMRAKYFLQQRDTVEAIKAQRMAIHQVDLDVKNAGVRAGAKVRLELLRMLLYNDQMREAQATIREITAIYEELPPAAKAIDNTWIQTIALSHSIDIREAIDMHDYDRLKSYLPALEYLYGLIDQLGAEVVTIIDKISVAQLQRDVDQLYIDVLYKLYDSDQLEWIEVRYKLATIKHDVVSNYAWRRHQITDDKEKRELDKIDKSLRSLAFATAVDSIDLRIDLLDRQQEILRLAANNEDLYEGPFLEYFLTENHIYYLLHGPSDHFIRKYKPSNLLEQISHLHQEIIAREDLSSSTSVRQLSQLLLPSELEVKEGVALILDEELQTVPFDVLAEYRRGEGVPLMFHMRLGQAVLDIDAPDYQEVLVVQPDYSAVSSVEDPVPELRYSYSEVDTIRAMANATILQSANLDRVTEASEGKDILHYTGHSIGGIRPQLLLTDQHQLSRVFLEELAQWSNAVDLVVLSSCESGEGGKQHGEIAPSIGGSVLATGVTNVLTSQWAVNDETMSSIIASFYHYLMREDLSPTDALYRAKRHFVTTQPPDRRHPYYWAGVQIVSQAPYARFSQKRLRVPALIVISISIFILCCAFYFR